MGSNYEKGVYNQLMEVMEKLNAMESEHRQDRKEIHKLTTEVKSLRKENASLRATVTVLEQKNAALDEKCTGLEAENRLLRDDNERMKRILDNRPHRKLAKEQFMVIKTRKQGNAQSKTFTPVSVAFGQNMQALKPTIDMFYRNPL